MSNTLLTPTIIAKEMLMQLENNCVFGDMVHREYKKEFVSIGNSVTIQKPVRFTSNSGSDATSNIQDVTETSTSISVNTQRHVAWLFNSNELTMSIKDYSEKYIKPAAIKLGNDIDVAGMELYKDIPLAAGTAGTTPSDFSNLGAAAQALDDNAVPEDRRGLIVNPAAGWAMADSFKNFYDKGVSSAAVKKGQLANIADFDIRKSQNVQTHTAGETAGTVLVDGSSQTGATLHVDGLTTADADLLQGDCFTIAGVYHVNPVSKASTGKLQQFTVTADVSAASNEVDLAIYPSIVTSGATQNVSAGPADGAAITFLASHAANMAFHRNAFAVVCCPLKIPDGATFGARASHNGYSIRIMKGYDIKTDEEICRLDVLFGVKAIYPELAVRLLG